MKRTRLFNLLFALALAASACNTSTATPTAAPTPTEPPAPTATPAPVSAIPGGPVRLNGKFDYSNDIITTYFTQHVVALFDMHGFVTRDLLWELPVDSQVLGFLDIDPDAMSATFFVDLPAEPRGTLNDVDNDGQTDAGVQIFVVAYSPNLTGGPYSESDDRSFGWPSYLASVKTDSENKNEVIGGKLVVWAPDDEQQFPTGFGPDGLLFTEDDPVGPAPVGYSIVDLDQKPFAVSTEAEPEFTLYEPKEAAIKDYSNMSYTEAFEELVGSVSTNWAFNGIESKEVDWGALYEEIRPRVAEAEDKRDALAYYQALRDFTLAIPDGHTGIGDSGGLGDEDFAQKTSGGYGFAIRELDDGRVIVIYVTPGGPAEAAGIQVGAEVTGFNGEPIKDAIGKVKPYAGPFSMESSKRYQQARYLLRTAVGVEAAVTFANPGGQPKAVTLASVAERDSFRRTSIYFGAPPLPNNPVEWRILASGSGYISINSYYDDLSLIITLFERALKQFTASGVTHIIIDLRFNGGGNPLGLAAFLTGKEITLGQQYSYSEETGQFEPVGVPGRVLPNKEQYRFDKIAILVGPACASACEQEAYSFSQVPGAIVVGMYPSGGIFADVLRGQYELPEGISIQIPTERFLNPDGSLYLEGTGVAPTVRVPITEDTVFAAGDVILQAAEDALLGISPDDLRIEGGPIVGAASTTEKALKANVKFLEQLAKEQYTGAQLAEMNKTFPYTVDLDKDQRLMWGWGWCATSAEILADNYKHIKVSFSVNGAAVDPSQFFEASAEQSGLFCKSYYAVVYKWPVGQTKLQTVVAFDAKINDGAADYPPGKQTFVYTVTLP